MLFNSLEFAIFVPIVFGLYWYVFNKNLKIQNLFILVASYVFYGWWDYRFLLLIFISSLCDYLVGQAIYDSKSDRQKKWLLWISLAVNLGLLGFYKYYNFFVTSFVDAFTLLGVKPNISTLNIILPVGISFYTFQTLSYTIDVYRGVLKPSKDFTSFFAYVSFFPQLVAGPIEKAKNLLPQFYVPRVFDYELARNGLRLILWGLFQKMVVADTCGAFTNIIYSDPDNAGFNEIILGTMFFGFQIYGDFSGYSYIAIGTARLFGFRLTTNFKYPYLSRSVPEFWQRWHITLMSWLRDYLYYPLRKGKKSQANRIFAVFIVFFVSGLWHGANWTFVIFGIIHGLYMIAYILLGLDTKFLSGVIAQGRTFPTLKELLLALWTYILVNIPLILFRGENLQHALELAKGMVLNPYVPFKLIYLEGIVLFCLMVYAEYFFREDRYPFERLNMSPATRYVFYTVVVFTILAYAANAGTEFIYFQF
ncbi:MAG TPA: MBOAT family O-acyltransferase [Saprospiraceae bacterium]|nr:MBOAT family O-acyltransferase [Saprospiraceae bacterium]HMQ83892.1 MBOAT family O-acyltransferase [Saprospiraceae bacterium]